MAAIAHVRNKPDSFVVTVGRGYFQAVHPQALGPTLIYDPFVGLGPGNEGRIVGLRIGQQNEQRLISRLLNPFFLIDFQAIRPTGEVHHPDAEQVRMIRYKKVGFEYFYAFDPKLVSNDLADRDILEFMLQKDLRYVIQASNL
jgi:hypothetical protein